MGEKEIQELIREERRRYAKEWRAKNPERVKAANRRYWEKKALLRAEVCGRSVSEECK